MSRSAVPSSAQLEKLVEYVEEKRWLATGHARTAQARDRTRATWQDVANKLNSDGEGCIKTWQQWAKYWKDKKAAVKKKASQMRLARQRTGGGAAEDAINISSIEERILAVMGGESFAVGDRDLELDPFPNLSNEVTTAAESDTAADRNVVVERIDWDYESPSILEVQNMQSMMVEVGTIGQMDNAIPSTSVEARPSEGICQDPDLTQPGPSLWRQPPLPDTQRHDESEPPPPPPSAPRNIASSVTSWNPRNKCALPPGHSLMDWIRLGNSGKDLTGVGGRLRPVSPRELALHNTKNDVWLAIRGRVYNITHYLPFHPGGQEELMRGAGIDATQLFDKVHPWVNYDSLLSKCLVGPLCIDRPSSEELFGSPNPSPKSDRLREPSKAQELVRKSMENLANCITPVKKKISSKSDDNVKPGNPSKIMQSLIMSSDLPVSISRRAGSNSPVRSKSSSGDDTPSPLRFDWIQTSVKLTISIYAGSLSNPGGCARLTEGALLIEIVTNEWLRTLKIVPEAKLKGPLQIKVYVESGKVEVTAQKAETSVWKSCGDTSASAATRVSSPRTVTCWVRSQGCVTHDTAMLGLAPEPGPVVVPLGYHVRIHCNVDGNEYARSYTPVGEGWSAEPAEVNASIKLAVKRYPDGALSKHLTALSVDDVVTLSGPYGNFQLQKLKGVSQIYFIAAGTGITPMLGLIRFMLARSNPKCEKSHLLFFNKKEEDILFHENFKEIARRDDRFKATHVLSEPASTWTSHTGRINSDLLSDMLGRSFKCGNECNHFVCLCGPTEFTQTGIQLLKALGVQENCLHAFMG